MTDRAALAAQLTDKLCFSTLGCPDWSWRNLIDKGTAFGFAGVEIRLLEREVDLLKCAVFQPSELPARRRELCDVGFRVCGLASSVRFHDSERDERQRQLETGKRYLDLAYELDAEFVRVFGDVIPNNARHDAAAVKSTLDWMAEGLDSLGAAAAFVGKRIVVETHGDFADSTLMERLMRKVTSPAVGVLWDTHHPWRFYGEAIGATFDRLKPWTMHTHWKDSVTLAAPSSSPSSDNADGQARSLMDGHRPADYVLMGEGEFPSAETLSRLIAAGYNGWLSLEWEKMWHPEIADPQTAFPRYVKRMHELLANHST